MVTPSADISEERGGEERVGADTGAPSLAIALQRLAAGDLDCRLPAGPDADAFNRVAELLAGASAPDSGLMAGLGGDSPDGFVAIVNIDRFGDLRRQVGSTVAAEILVRLCDRLRDCVPGLRLGRVGRTQIEFVFPAGNEAEAWRAMKGVRRVLEARLKLSGESFDLDIAIGLARCGTAGESALENAAIAVAQARSSPARIAVFNERERVEARERLGLLRDLHRALDSGQLSLAYQPKLDARSGRFDAAEALLRWRHPERGLVPPDRFISLAEETGVILDLTRWVVTQALADGRALERRERPMSLHVNLSGRLVADPDFAAWLLSAVEGLERGALGLEITETAVIDEPEKALANLHAFADAGMPIAIDDYGSGLSSLAYLKELPATELKIDKMFISELTTSHRDPLLVRSTIDLAHALDMKVTAEGVESPEAMALLCIMGCDLVQGYIVSPAIPIEALQTFVSHGGKITQPSVLPGAFRRSGT